VSLKGKVKKQILNTIYSVGGFRPFHYLNRRDVLVLTYHRFAEESDPTVISRSEFEEHLGYLKKNSNVLSLADVVSRIDKGEDLPENTVVITIDDGYRDSFEIAYPLLKANDLPATLFVISDFLDGKIWLWTDIMRFVILSTRQDSISIEFEDKECVNADLSDRNSRIEAARLVNDRLKTLSDDAKSAKIDEIAEMLEVSVTATPPSDYAPISWDQAREMDQNGISVESHTVSHPILTKISESRLKLELEESKSIIGQQLGREVHHFCYPNGSYDERVRDAAEAAGYLSAVSTNYGFYVPGSDRYTIKRIDGQPSIASFAQSVSGFEKIREKVGI